MSFQLQGDSTEIYEQVLVPLWFGRWAAALVDHLALAPGERVLDVACGTGVATRIARERVGPKGRVDGLDINASMLATAAGLAGDLDIRWLERDAAQSGPPAAGYDVVMSQHGCHYLPDKLAALREFRRLLRPGGRLAFSIWAGHSPYAEAVCAAVERHVSPEAAQRQGSQRETPSPETLADRMHEAGFTDVAVLRQELIIETPLAETFAPLHLASMPIAQAVRSLPEADRATMMA